MDVTLHNGLDKEKNLSARMTFTIEVEEMIGVDKLPDIITLTDEVLPETIPGDTPVALVAR